MTPAGEPEKYRFKAPQPLVVTNYCHHLHSRKDSNTRLCKTALPDYLLTHPCGSISKKCNSVLFLVRKYPLDIVQCPYNSVVSLT